MAVRQARGRFGLPRGALEGHSVTRPVKVRYPTASLMRGNIWQGKSLILRWLQSLCEASWTVSQILSQHRSIEINARACAKGHHLCLTRVSWLASPWSLCWVLWASSRQPSPTGRLLRNFVGQLFTMLIWLRLQSFHGKKSSKTIQQAV